MKIELGEHLWLRMRLFRMRWKRSAEGICRDFIVVELHRGPSTRVLALPWLKVCVSPLSSNGELFRQSKWGALVSGRLVPIVCHGAGLDCGPVFSPLGTLRSAFTELTVMAQCPGQVTTLQAQGHGLQPRDCPTKGVFRSLFNRDSVVGLSLTNQNPPGRPSVGYATLVSNKTLGRMMSGAKETSVDSCRDGTI